MTQEQVARRGRIAASKVSNIENGRSKVSMFDVSGLCQIYGASQDQTAELVRMSDQADQAGWWESFTSTKLKQFSVILELEEVCSGLWSYQGEYIPGLLQTERYARAIQQTGLFTDQGEAEDTVALRIERQRRFWDRDPLPRVRFILHESAVTRPVCGVEGDAEQRARLLKAGNRADIRVVRQSVGAHPSMRSSYLILESGIEDIPDVVYLEALNGSTYAEDERALTVHRTAFEATYKVTTPIGEFLDEHFGLA